MYVTFKFISLQYGGFLAIVFVLQLGTGLSIFAYRSKLTAGFDQGLTQGMINYRNYTSPSANDFDLIQETVSDNSAVNNQKLSDIKRTF